MRVREECTRGRQPATTGCVQSSFITALESGGKDFIRVLESNALWRRVERGERVARQDIKAGHGLRERLNPEQRAGRRAGGNATPAIGVNAGCERAQTGNRSQDSSRRD